MEIDHDISGLHCIRCNCHQHIELWTKLPTFGRVHIRMHFLKEHFCLLIIRFLKIVSRGSIDNLSVIHPGVDIHSRGYPSIDVVVFVLIELAGTHGNFHRTVNRYYLHLYLLWKYLYIPHIKSQTVICTKFTFNTLVHIAVWYFLRSLNRTLLQTE